MCSAAGTASTGSPRVSACTTCSLRPMMPPLALISVIATVTPCSAASPTDAYAPVKGCRTPKVMAPLPPPAPPDEQAASSAAPATSVMLRRTRGRANILGCAVIANVSCSPPVPLDSRASPADVKLDHLLVLQQLSGGTGQTVPAENQHVRPVGVSEGAPGVLLDHHDRDPGLADRDDVLPHRRLELRRHPGRGLVDEQDLGV